MEMSQVSKTRPKIIEGMLFVITYLFNKCALIWVYRCDKFSKFESSCQPTYLRILKSAMKTTNYSTLSFKQEICEYQF